MSEVLDDQLFEVRLFEAEEAEHLVETTFETLRSRFDMDQVAAALRGHQPGQPVDWHSFEQDRSINRPHFYKTHTTDMLAAVVPGAMEELDVLPSYGTGFSRVMDKREDGHDSVHAFKVRGAMFAALEIVREKPDARVITTASAGNHALGVLKAAHVLNAYLVQNGMVRTDVGGNVLEEDRHLLYRVDVYCAQSISPAKLGMLREKGAANVYNEYPSLETAIDAAEAAAADPKTVMIHAFNDHRVVAGQATLGMELLFDLVDQGVDLRADNITAYVEVGGGGLFHGVTSVWRWAKREGLLNPTARLVPAEMVNCDSSARARQGRESLTLKTIDRDAEGLATLQAGTINQPVIAAYGEWPVVAPKDYVMLAVDGLTQAHDGQAPELAAAVSYAAMLYAAETDPDFGRDKRSVHVTLTTGRNVAPATLRKNSLAFAEHPDRRVVLAAHGLGQSAMHMTMPAEVTTMPRGKNTVIGGYTLRSAVPAPHRARRLQVADGMTAAFHTQLEQQGLFLAHFGQV